MDSYNDFDEDFIPEDRRALDVDNLTRVSIGPKGEADLQRLQGFTISSHCEKRANEETGELQDRWYHVIRLRKPVGENKEVVVWGSYGIDRKLPRLPPGTPVDIRFVEKISIGARQLKRITVSYPQETVLGPPVPGMPGVDASQE